jgi:hypothetical protein
MFLVFSKFHVVVTRCSDSMCRPKLYWTDGQTDRLFFHHENPQFLSAKGTTKKAEALELFVYPNYSILFSSLLMHENWSD